MPKSIILHLSIGVNGCLSLTTKQLLGNLVESIVRQSCSLDGNTFLHEVEQHHLYNHVIHRQHPLTRRQLRKLLHQLHILNKVDVCLVGEYQFTAFNLTRGILQDIQITTEAEVLLVIREKMQVYATVAANSQCIFNIETVERNGSITDW